MVVKPFSPDKLWGADEYLAWESAQEYKNELIDKRVWVMLGADLQHNRIQVNLNVLFYRMFKDRDFTALGSRTCLQIDPDSTFVYPDLMLFEGLPPEHFRRNQCYFKDPLVVFEIVSLGTEAMDRGRKKDLYLQLESLRTYILISQHMPRIEAYTRREDGWHFRLLSGLDETLEIAAPACTLPLSEIYLKLQFDSSLPS